jgi:hypothetical protein
MPIKMSELAVIWTRCDAGMAVNAEPTAPMQRQWAQVVLRAAQV